MQVNYLSDFKLEAIIKKSLIGVPFKFVYNVGGKTREISYDGTSECVGCTKESDTKFMVVFDDHGFPAGRMTCDRTFYIPDTDYPDGVREVHTHDTLDVTLVTGSGDKDKLVSDYVCPSYLKPIKGQDYNTEEDQAEEVAAVKESALKDLDFIKSLSASVQAAVITAVTAALEADTDFASAIATAVQSAVTTSATESIKADTTVQDAIATAIQSTVSNQTITALEGNDTFKSAISDAVKATLKDDDTFQSYLANAISDHIKADVTTAVKTNVLADDDFNTSVASKASTTLKTDADFQTALVSAIKDAVVEAVKGDVTTAVTTAALADETFIAAVAAKVNPNEGE